MSGLSPSDCSLTVSGAAMHGVKRQRPGQRDPEDVAQAKLARERSRIAEYTALRQDLAQALTRRDYSGGTLALTSRILLSNPEYPTGWASRRRILSRGLFPDSQPPAIQATLEGDLDLTSQCLRRNPKEYAVWEHRKWVLKTMPDPDWRMELKTVEALLEKDARNFHGWDYRHYVVRSIRQAGPPLEGSTRKRPKPTTTSELAYTTSKISASFSNYSAWHYRSKLLPVLWQEQGHASASSARRQRINEEFELVKQALYTDPDDQSAWIYHRWLVGQSGDDIVEREIVNIKELLELESESKWCLDSLAVYEERLAHSTSDSEARAQLTTSRLQYLRMLQRVDPLRGGRYRDLAHEAGTHSTAS